MLTSRSELHSAPRNIHQGQIESNEVTFIKKLHQDQKFWKYHILKTGLYQFYITTNPDERHKYIRKAPSYTVVYNPQGKNQYTLTFIRQTLDRVDNSETNENVESFMVSRDQTGRFSISGVVSQYISTSSVPNLKVFKSIPQRSSKGIAAAEKDQSRAKWMRNSEIMFDDDRKYAINHPKWGQCQLGSLLNKGHTLSKLMNSTDDNTVTPLSDHSVYFFKDNTRRRASFWYDGLVSFYRPCKRDVMNKLSYNMKHLKLNNRFSNPVGVTEETYQDDDDDDVGDFETDDTIEVEKGSTFSRKGNSGSSSPLINSDNNFASNYYTAKDGLFHKHSKDDSPSDFKLGWITIFDNEVENFTNPNGNWEIVLGLTFAVGLERNLQDYLQKEKAQLL